MTICPVCRFELDGFPDTCPDCHSNLSPNAPSADIPCSIEEPDNTAKTTRSPFTLQQGLLLEPSFQIDELISPLLALGLCLHRQIPLRFEIIQGPLATATQNELLNWFKAAQELPEDRRPPLSEVLELRPINSDLLLIIETFPGPPLLEPPSPLSLEQLLEVPKLAEWLQRYQSLSGIRPDDWRWTTDKLILCGALGARIRSLKLGQNLEAAHRQDAIELRALLLKLIERSAETPPWAQDLQDSARQNNSSTNTPPQSPAHNENLDGFIPLEAPRSDLPTSATTRERADLSIAKLLRIMTRDITPQTLTPTRRSGNTQSTLQPLLISGPIPELSIASGAPAISKSRELVPGPHFIPLALHQERERLRREAASRYLEPPLAMRDYQIQQLCDDLRIYPSAAWVLIAACAPNLSSGLLTLAAAFALWPIAPGLSRNPNPALLFIIPLLLALPPLLSGYSGIVIPALLLAILHASRATTAREHGLADRLELEQPLERSLQATTRLDIEQGLTRARLAVSAGLGLAISIIPALLASSMNPALVLCFAFSLGMTFTLYNRDAAENASRQGGSFADALRKPLIYAALLTVLPLTQTPLALLAALASTIAFALFFPNFAEPAFASELNPQALELDPANVFADLDAPPDLNAVAQPRTASKAQRLQ